MIIISGQPDPCEALEFITKALQMLTSFDLFLWEISLLLTLELCTSCPGMLYK